MPELKNYMHCPHYYQFKWVQQVPLFKVRAKEYWFNALRSCSIDFFKTWISFDKPRLEDLQALWQKCWYEEPLALNWKGTTRQETQQTLGNQGWLVLTRLYRFTESRPIILGGADWPFMVDAGEHKLSGSIDLLLYTDESKTNFEAIKFVKSTYEATKMAGHNDVELTAWRKVLKDLTNARGGFEPVLRYYVLDNVQNPVVQTHRNDGQECVLFDTIKAVAGSVGRSEYYPHYGNRCNTCDYKDLCNKGNWKEEDD
jgi:hypothetical protein